MTTTRNKSAHTRAKAGVGALDDMFQPFNRSDAPGLVVGVAQHGKVLYRRGFGLASIEHATANTPHMRVTKAKPRVLVCSPMSRAPTRPKRLPSLASIAAIR